MPYVPDGTTTLRALRKPERCTTLLWFPAGCSLPSGEYDVRGGIVWPEPQPDGTVSGFAIAVGRPVGWTTIYALDERHWSSMEHVTDATGGRVLVEGLIPWLLTMWQRYYLARWWYTGDREQAARHVVAANASELLWPKPEWLNAEWRDERYSISVYREMQAADRLNIPKSSAVYRANMRYSAAPGGELPAELNALLAVVTSYDRWGMDEARKG